MERDRSGDSICSIQSFLPSLASRPEACSYFPGARPLCLQIPTLLGPSCASQLEKHSCRPWMLGDGLLTAPKSQGHRGSGLAALAGSQSLTRHPRGQIQSSLDPLTTPAHASWGPSGTGPPVSTSISRVTPRILPKSWHLTGTR